MNSSDVLAGDLLIIHPPYVHHSLKNFVKDENPFLPLGPLYAGQLLEEEGKASVQYFDCQLHDVNTSDLGKHDNYGIAVMGAQNIAPAHDVYLFLLDSGIPPENIHLGGQGVEGLTVEEFEKLFPKAKLVRDGLMSSSGYWSKTLSSQIEKFSEEDLKAYFTNELTMLFSQGCKFKCSFCGARTGMRENFYNVAGNLEAYLTQAKRLGLTELTAYVTSLDFFQQALKQGDINILAEKLEDIIKLKEKYGIDLNLRALTRADSYNRAMESEYIRDLVKQAGFNTFGFGADGAASPLVLKAMRKGSSDLKSDLISAFKHAEKNGFVPEILYVFGIEADTPETLKETKELCTLLLTEFPNSVYRGFPAKDFIPGNSNWNRTDWKSSPEYELLLQNPQLFLNLGFETLANHISHADAEQRKLVNKYAVEMSLTAHKLGRVQSFLTVPIAESGSELMDEETFDKFRQIVGLYAPETASELTLENLPEQREEINKKIPKDS